VVVWGGERWGGVEILPTSVSVCHVQDFSVEPVGNLLPHLLAYSGTVLLADPSERTRHNRQACPSFFCQPRVWKSTLTHSFIDH
jgi:hypothetical protein